VQQKCSIHTAFVAITHGIATLWDFTWTEML